MVGYFFDKQSKGSDIGSMSNEQLADELHEPIVRKFMWLVFLQNMLGLFL